MDPKIGYKIINKDWTSLNRKKKYSCPGIFEEDVEPAVARIGLHYYPTMKDLMNEMSDCGILTNISVANRLRKHRIMLVLVLGNIDTMNVDEIICSINIACTNKLHIVRELSIEEVYNIYRNECRNSCRSNWQRLY